MHLALPTMVLTALLLSGPLAHAERGAPGPHRRAAGPMGAPAGPGRLRNQAQRMCLDAAGWAAPASANVLLWGCNGDPDQVWSFRPSGELVNAANGTCLAVANGRGVQGADVGIDRCDGSRDQRWRLIDVGGGAFELHNQRRELCLDVNGREGAQGDDVLLWACDGGADQTWRWEPAAPPVPIARRPPPGEPRHAPPRIQPMDPPTFQRLLAAIKEASFSEEQTSVIEQAASSSFFLVAQCKEVVKGLSFSADQVRAVELMAPKLLDREHAFELFGAFTFDADKEQVKRILERTARVELPVPPAREPVVPARMPAARDPYACSSPQDCELACPSAPGCCGWPCGCSHAIRRDQKAAYESSYGSTCKRRPQCPAVACLREDFVPTCREGRCVAERR
jgi:hypothetical protein